MPRTVTTTRPAKRKAQQTAAPSALLKTLPLRELLRRPLKVKQLVAAGHGVRITDNGRPLWLVLADSGSGDTAEATQVAAAWEDTLGDLEAEARQGDPPALSVTRLLIAQRHEALR